LEFGDRKTGEFMPATPQEGIVYMNIGDMFQRISNGEFSDIQRQRFHTGITQIHTHANFRNSLGFYPSALHRVVISGKANGEPTPARYSIPYFVVPLPDGVIEPQPSLVTAHGKQVYEPVTFNSYSEQMFKITQIHDAKE
jgi:isopenicillin N synthase-like dioxygenase